MKAYIVIDSPSYEQSTILAVCSSKEIAEQYIKDRNSKGYQIYNDVEIEEWDLDSHLPQPSVIVDPTLRSKQ